MTLITKAGDRPHSPVQADLRSLGKLMEPVMKEIYEKTGERATVRNIATPVARNGVKFIL